MSEYPETKTVDIFQNWAQYRAIRIVGYTLRDGTSVTRLHFPSGTPSKEQVETLQRLLGMGMLITAIHYEDKK